MPEDKALEPEDTDVPEVIAHSADDEEVLPCICDHGSTFLED
jgi:hypothetical protein